MSDEETTKAHPTCLGSFWLVAAIATIVGVGRGSASLVLISGIMVLVVATLDGALTKDGATLTLNLGGVLAREAQEQEQHDDDDADDADADDDEEQEEEASPSPEEEKKESAQPRRVRFRPAREPHEDLVEQVIGRDRQFAREINARALSNAVAPIESRAAQMCMLQTTTPPPSKDPYCVLRE